MEKCKKVMKRSKKQGGSTYGQLCLFETPRIRQEEETRRKPKIKPAEALKLTVPALVPPTPVEAVKTPENSLKTEMPDRDTLNRLWKANPGALHTLNRMKEINPHIITLVQAFCLVPYKEPVNR